jgi:hypothetical protein
MGLRFLTTFHARSRFARGEEELHRQPDVGERCELNVTMCSDTNPRIDAQDN